MAKYICGPKSLGISNIAKSGIGILGIRRLIDLLRTSDSFGEAVWQIHVYVCYFALLHHARVILSAVIK